MLVIMATYYLCIFCGISEKNGLILFMIGIVIQYHVLLMQGNDSKLNDLFVQNIIFKMLDLHSISSSLKVQCLLFKKHPMLTYSYSNNFYLW